MSDKKTLKRKREAEAKEAAAAAATLHQLHQLRVSRSADTKPESSRMEAVECGSGLAKRPYFQMQASDSHTLRLPQRKRFKLSRSNRVVAFQFQGPWPLPLFPQASITTRSPSTAAESAQMNVACAVAAQLDSQADVIADGDGIEDFTLNVVGSSTSKVSPPPLLPPISPVAYKQAAAAAQDVSAAGAAQTPPSQEMRFEIPDAITTTPPSTAAAAALMEMGGAVAAQVDVKAADADSMRMILPQHPPLPLHPPFAPEQAAVAATDASAAGAAQAQAHAHAEAQAQKTAAITLTLPSAAAAASQMEEKGAAQLDMQADGMADHDGESLDIFLPVPLPLLPPISPVAYKQAAAQEFPEVQVLPQQAKDVETSRKLVREICLCAVELQQLY